MATRIHKRKEKYLYVVYFENPINKENKQIGNFTEFKKAIELARDTDSEFYSKHPYLIPSGITLDKANKKQLKTANIILEPKGLELVEEGKTLRCVIIYSIDNLYLFNDEPTTTLVNCINKDINSLGFIGSHSINLH